MVPESLPITSLLPGTMWQLLVAEVSRIPPLGTILRPSEEENALRSTAWGKGGYEQGIGTRGFVQHSLLLGSAAKPLQ